MQDVGQASVGLKTQGQHGLWFFLGCPGCLTLIRHNEWLIILAFCPGFLGPAVLFTVPVGKKVPCYKGTRVLIKLRSYEFVHVTFLCFIQL